MDSRLHAFHSHCFACSPDSAHGLRLSCHSNPDGITTATWQPSSLFQSYDGRIHGGILATLIDSSMVHTLFARGIAGVTAELTVRYHHPVSVDSEVEISAWLDGEKHGIYRLCAELRQEGRIAAKAHAKFMSMPARPESKDDSIDTNLK